MSMNKVCSQFSFQAFKGLGLMGLLITGGNGPGGAGA